MRVGLYNATGGTGVEAGLLLRGMLIGLAIAAPVGPIGVLCIRRTLRDGPLAGLITGLGAASADAIYGAIAAFGLGAVMSRLTGISFWTQLIGGVFLVYLGLRTLLERPAEHAANVNRRGLLGAYASTFLLTLTNPATIIAFLAIFAGLGLGAGVAGWNALLLVGGVFLGSATWWLLLSGGVSLFRSRMTPRNLRWVNIVAGLILLGFGLAALAASVMGVAA
jgi:threonine/homoserine/homoserine lactone efflux protein